VRISLLLHNGYGVGGTVRTVLNLAGALARRHRVEVVSVLRRLDRPMLEVPPGVSLVPLVDLRPGAADAADPRAREVSAVVPAQEEFFRFYSRLTDERIAAHLDGSPADVVIGTRSALNLCVARLAPPDRVRIAQEHMTQDMIPAEVLAGMRRHYPGLSAVVTVTQADAVAVRANLGAGAPPVHTIANSVPDPGLAPADGTSKIVVAAGRLDRIKRYDLLVRAFAKVVTERPDWQLRIYGAGGQAAPLAALVAGLGLSGHVFLMGPRTPLEAEWVKGSIAAVTSDRESFGMTVVEAMRCGVPVVSTACPVGPAEIISDGADGLLVPPGDVDAITAALLRLMNDDPLRHALGRAAAVSARRYDPALIAARYEELFRTLGAAAPRRPHRPAVRGHEVAMRRIRTELTLALPGRLRPGRPGQRYVADCRMAGNRITVRVAHDRLGWAMTHLLFRARGGDAVVLVPLTGTATEWEASFAADEPLLAEGRWDLFLRDRRGRRHRLRAGRLDVRGLLGGCAEELPLVRNVPYPTTDGHLAVAAWQREQHAEAGLLDCGRDRITVTGRLLGAAFGDRPHLRLVRRTGDPGELVVPGTAEDGSGFRFEVPAAGLAALRLRRAEDWDALVGSGTDGTPVPLARLLDDVVERGKTYVYPVLTVDDDVPPELSEEWPVPEVRVRPYFTMGSGLAFAVTEQG
jgi:glycosyltransferase involved in cell wall biosynthesis